VIRWANREFVKSSVSTKNRIFKKRPSADKTVEDAKFL
jgi:hypothetical protein